MSLQFIIFFFNQSNIKMKGMWEGLEIEDAIILEDNKIEEDNNKNEQSVNKLFIKGSYGHKYISLTLFITYKLHLSADQLILSEDTGGGLQIVGLLGRAALYNYLFGPEIGLLLLGLDLIDNV